MLENNDNKNFLSKSWEFITNKNDYKRGYNDGYQDAVNGKQKSYPNIASLKSLVHGDKTMETYKQGYDEGYRKGMYAKQQKKTENMDLNDILNSNTQNKNSEQSNSLKQQIALLEELKNKMLSLQKGLTIISSSYRKTVEQLRDEGLATELYEKLLHEYYEQTNRQIVNLNEHLNEEDIVFINKKRDEFNAIVEKMK